MAEANGPSKHVKPLVQDCWKAMRKGCEMTKIWANSPSKLPVDLKHKPNNKVSLSRDQSLISYHTRKILKTIDISTVKKVLNPETNPGKFKAIDKRYHLDRCFGVAYVSSKTSSKERPNDEKIEEVFFIAPNADEATLWIIGIKYLIHNRATRILDKERRENWLKNEFDRLRGNSGGDTIKYVTILNFLTSQGLHAEPRLVKRFLKNSIDKVDDITCDEFVVFMQEYLKRQELTNLFTQTSSNGAFLTVDDLLYFLTNRQLQNSTRDQCQRLIHKYEVTQQGRKHNELGFDGFVKLMASVDGELFNPEHDRVYQNMNRPFAHYYIASSHNTYLVDDQYKGDSSANQYVKVLKEGCRCIELDCWDGDHGEPVIYHGHTLTSKILFKDVIKKIKRHAFEASQYPLILNIENHCSIEYQKKMASYLIEILGDYLQKEPVDESLPATPEAFKYKIFVRGKKLKSQISDSPSMDVLSSSSDESDDEDDNNSQNERKKKKKHHKPIAQELSSLINYFVNVHFNSFEYSERFGRFYQTSSFSERKMIKLANRCTDEFIAYNTRQISRIYPGGFRLDSSNFDPEEAWNIGCQIVALNLQTQCLPVQLHHGKFRQNGRAGYVLKPSFLLDPEINFDPHEVKQNMAKVLKLTIISGHRLSFPGDEHDSDHPDTFVQVEIIGVPEDRYSYRTKTVRDNNYNPKWSEGFITRVVVPELAMVRFSVYDEDKISDDFMGQVCMPFMSMRQGYRHVILLNQKGESHTSGCLFVHLTIHEDKPTMNSTSQMKIKSPGQTKKSLLCFK